MQQVTLVLQVLLVKQEPRALRVPPELRGQQVSQVPPEPQVLLVQPAPLVLQVPLVQREQPV